MAEGEGGAGRAWTKRAVAQKGHSRHAESAVYPINLRTRLSRSNGYRELGMFDESILILEDIPFDEDRWHPLVVEAPFSFMTRCVIS